MLQVVTRGLSYNHRDSVRFTVRVWFRGNDLERSEGVIGIEGGFIIGLSTEILVRKSDLLGCLGESINVSEQRSSKLIVILSSLVDREGIPVSWSSAY